MTKDSLQRDLQKRRVLYREHLLKCGKLKPSTHAGVRVAQRARNHEIGREVLVLKPRPHIFPLEWALSVSVEVDVEPAFRGWPLLLLNRLLLLDRSLLLDRLLLLGRSLLLDLLLLLLLLNSLLVRSRPHPVLDRLERVLRLLLLLLLLLLHLLHSLHLLHRRRYPARWTVWDKSDLEAIVERTRVHECQASRSWRWSSGRWETKATGRGIKLT